VNALSEENDLLARLEQLLGADAYANDTSMVGRISLEMGTFISESLDKLQQAALDAASEYWQGKSDEKDRMEFLSQLSARCSEDARLRRIRGVDGYRNRLVFSALTSNTGMTGFAGEFLIEIGMGAGLSCDQVERSIRKVLPQLPKKHV
jgi:hypothetical protein